MSQHHQVLVGRKRARGANNSTTKSDQEAKLKAAMAALLGGGANNVVNGFDFTSAAAVVEHKEKSGSIQSTGEFGSGSGDNAAQDSLKTGRFNIAIEEDVDDDELDLVRALNGSDDEDSTNLLIMPSYPHSKKPSPSPDYKPMKPIEKSRSPSPEYKPKKPIQNEVSLKRSPSPEYKPKKPIRNEVLLKRSPSPEYRLLTKNQSSRSHSPSPEYKPMKTTESAQKRSPSPEYKPLTFDSDTSVAEESPSVEEAGAVRLCLKGLNFAATEEVVFEECAHILGDADCILSIERFQLVAFVVVSSQSLADLLIRKLHMSRDSGDGENRLVMRGGYLQVELAKNGSYEHIKSKYWGSVDGDGSKKMKKPRFDGGPSSHHRRIIIKGASFEDSQTGKSFKVKAKKSKKKEEIEPKDFHVASFQEILEKKKENLD